MIIRSIEKLQEQKELVATQNTNNYIETFLLTDLEKDCITQLCNKIIKNSAKEDPNAIGNLCEKYHLWKKDKINIIHSIMICYPLFKDQDYLQEIVINIITIEFLFQYTYLFLNTDKKNIDNTQDNSSIIFNLTEALKCINDVKTYESSSKNEIQLKIDLPNNLIFLTTLPIIINATEKRYGKNSIVLLQIDVNNKYLKIQLDLQIIIQHNAKREINKIRGDIIKSDINWGFKSYKDFLLMHKEFIILIYNNQKSESVLHLTKDYRMRHEVIDNFLMNCDFKFFLFFKYLNKQYQKVFNDFLKKLKKEKINKNDDLENIDDDYIMIDEFYENYCIYHFVNLKIHTKFLNFIVKIFQDEEFKDDKMNELISAYAIYYNSIKNYVNQFFRGYHYQKTNYCAQINDYIIKISDIINKIDNNPNLQNIEYFNLLTSALSIKIEILFMFIHIYRIIPDIQKENQENFNKSYYLSTLNGVEFYLYYDLLKEIKTSDKNQQIQNIQKIIEKFLFYTEDLQFKLIENLNKLYHKKFDIVKEDLSNNYKETIKQLNKEL